MKEVDLNPAVKKLQEHIKLKKDDCLEEEKPSKSDDKILIPGYQPIPISSYKLKNHSNQCLLLAMPETSMTTCLRRRENGGTCP